MAAAWTIQEEFSAFTCYNPSLTLSGGMSLHHVKYPLYQAVADAKDNLEAAKCFIRGNGYRKNAFGFWGTVVDWSTLQWLRDWKERLTRLLEGVEEEGKRISLSRGFLHKLASIYALWKTNEETLRRKMTMSTDELKRHIHYHRWLWRLVYQLVREDRRFQGDLKELQENLVKKERIAHLNILVRWVELSTRKEVNSSE